MKKGIGKKELREQNKQAARNAYSARDKVMAEESKKTEAIKKAKQQEQVRSMEALLNSAANGDINAVKALLAKEEPDEKNNKKSLAKAAGLKSVFTLNADNQLLMTAFGRGNVAINEKMVKGESVEDLQKEPAFSARVENEHFLISGRQTAQAIADSPVHSKKAAGDDLIGLRRPLEKIYFGENFEDNIHIQLIYNILDIDKILTVHINNIVYEINNLFRKEDEFDLIGTLSLNQTFENFAKPDSLTTKKQYFWELMKMPQRAYFGEALYRTVTVDKKKKPDTSDAENRRCYYILCLLGLARQSLAHGSDDARNAIYQLDTSRKEKWLAAMEVLDELYSRKIKSLNNGFLKKASQKNLPLLFDALNATTDERRAAITRMYYDFVVRKEFKNMGFSISELRERMLDLPSAIHLTEKAYDTVRSKLYMLMDYIIYDWYTTHPQVADDLVNQLRASTSDAEKKAIYFVQATALWKNIGNTIQQNIASKLTAANIKNICPVELPGNILDKVSITTKATGFSKMIYLLTCFQDGKEINELLTGLINKFDNIASFIDVLKANHLTCNFTQEYQMFLNSAAIAKELRTINSFARMPQELEATKPVMFIEAAKILGFRGTDQQLQDMINEMLDQDMGIRFSNGKKDNGFRNFIINNVLESKRFQYLVRYANPETVCAMARNKTVTRFVLNDIPDAQILRYYNSFTGSDNEMVPGIRDNLATAIAELSFSDFQYLRTNAEYATATEAIELERKKSLVRLYLTVLYILIKNLNYVNSRYFLAFHCVERDSIIYDPSYRQEYADPKRKDFSKFAMERVNDDCLNARATKYIKDNKDNSDPMVIRGYRNAIEHMDAVRMAHRYIADIRSFSSYFELYHYLVQRYLIDDYRNDPYAQQKMAENNSKTKMPQYFALVEKHHTYCKDMVKALNVPFAYNLPRYKNLSINELFDRNHFLPDKAKRDAIKPEED